MELDLSINSWLENPELITFLTTSALLSGWRGANTRNRFGFEVKSLVKVSKIISSSPE